jgi:hypothetical protein
LNNAQTIPASDIKPNSRADRPKPNPLAGGVVEAAIAGRR